MTILCEVDEKHPKEVSAYGTQFLVWLLRIANSSFQG
jgi:hypothetical protein